MTFVDTFIKNHPIKRIKINNVNGEYIVGGKSTIGFLIFPGGGQDIYSSYDLIDVYEKKYKVISLNITGFRDLKIFFNFINKILKEEKIKKVIVHGLSLGGFFAQHYARANKEKVTKLILSHTASTKSPTMIKKIIIPGKIFHFFLPIIPLGLLRFIVKTNSGRVQSGHMDILSLWKKYSSKTNLERRREFIDRFGLKFLNKQYLDSFYRLGIDMEKEEQKWNINDLRNWGGNVLLIKSSDDPLAQDNGILRKYYPKAKEYVFNGTGHLTQFIQFEKVIKIIDEFIKNN